MKHEGGSVLAKCEHARVPGPRHRSLRLTSDLATDKRQLESGRRERPGRASLKERLGESTGQWQWVRSLQRSRKSVRRCRRHPPRQVTLGAGLPRAGLADAVKRTPGIRNGRPLGTTAAICAALESSELKEVCDTCKHGSAPVETLPGVLYTYDKGTGSSLKG